MSIRALQRNAGNAAVGRIIARSKDEVGTGGASIENLPMLFFGSKGPVVKFAQRLLNGFGSGLAVDGIYGPKTTSNVREFQGSQSLNPDGVVGQNTWTQLHGGTTNDVASPRDNSDVQLPSHFIIPHKKTTLRAQIFFPTDRLPSTDGAALSGDDRDVLKQLSSAIKQSETIARATADRPYELILFGFADRRGSGSSNAALARRRAENVANTLSAYLGPTVKVRTTVHPIGEISAGSDSDSDYALATYRRVDVRGYPLEFEKKPSSPPKTPTKDRWFATLKKSSHMPPFAPAGLHRLKFDVMRVTSKGKRTASFRYTGPFTTVPKLKGFTVPDKGLGSGDTIEFDPGPGVRKFTHLVGVGGTFEMSVSHGDGRVWTSLQLFGPPMHGVGEAVELNWIRTAGGLGVGAVGSSPGTVEFDN